MGALQEAARPRTDHERDVRCNDVHSKWRSSQCSSFFYVAGSKLGETLNLMVNTSASELGSPDLRDVGHEHREPQAFARATVLWLRHNRFDLQASRTTASLLPARTRSTLRTATATLGPEALDSLRVTPWGVLQEVSPMSKGLTANSVETPMDASAQHTPCKHVHGGRT